MNRKPIACPDWYPSDFSELDKIMREGYVHEQGPGSLPGRRSERRIKILVVPYGPYSIVGPCGAWGFKEVAECALPDTFIVLGSTEEKVKASTFLFAPWETPLGLVNVDKDVGMRLVKEKVVVNEASAHVENPRVEAQLPMLQFACRDILNALKVVPVAVGSTSIEELRGVAEGLADLYLDQDLQVVLIVSANLPSSAAMQYVTSGDAEGLLNFVERKGIQVHEVAPLVVAMEYAKCLSMKKVRIIHQYPFSLITKKKDEKIVCAAITFE